MGDREFIERLVEELNDIKDYYNPTQGLPFMFIEDKVDFTNSDNYKETAIQFRLIFGTKNLVSYRVNCKILNEELESKLYKDFIHYIMRYILFFRDSKDEKLKSIQTIITTIPVREEVNYDLLTPEVLKQYVKDVFKDYK